jgi:anti-sigma regulatory factor (Ser/Thr protein kinase)
MLFEERFKTALVRAGATSGLAHGLLGALNEMASNAVEHAEAPVAPVTTYEIRDGQWAFSVTDVGSGVLGSLRRNPKYASVASDVAAVRLAVQDGVSRTGNPSRGRGFAHVFKALVNRMCTIRFRSSGALASWEGTSPAAHQLTLSPSPERAGFHVLVSSGFDVA